jgi:AcrR family transcriptional regulator
MTNPPDRKRLDPVKTRETILEAALDVFAAKGFDGTSIADIAAVAQVPKSLLQYHFGTKDELWKACLEQKALPLLQPLDRFLENHDTANMTALVAARFQILRDNPKVARALAWASMGSAPVPDFLTVRRQQIVQMGMLAPDTSELTRLLFALAAMDGWFLYRNLYRSALGDMVAEEALTDRFLQFLLRAMQMTDSRHDTKSDDTKETPHE